jgi:hypothetical protein
VTAWLPEIVVEGIADPVVEVRTMDGDLVHVRRLRGTTCHPGVFASGEYRLHVRRADGSAEAVRVVRAVAERAKSGELRVEI